MSDLFVFPDIYFGETQVYLRGIGKRVFGSGLGDELEIYRDDAKKHFKELGIPQGNYEIIKGIDKLKSFLKSHKDQWVKIDKTRGDSETFKAENYELIEPRLLELEHLLGPKKDEMIFIVEEDLKDTLDLAIDTYCIDGEYPTSALLGMEEKGECYIGAFKKWTEMPPKLVNIYDKLSDTMESYEYRNFFSAESRIGKGGVFLNDPCCRFGSPPGELQINMFKNLPRYSLVWGRGKMY